ncbi:cadherin-like beta sandwich domain-containing protein [Paenibacillus sp. CN-4]|uniref:cadherin-like beta sandwich domain-containing protein n=1 Tax=Paenibacillus nanchangensis TaxID=3348343 RepID=UPI00397BC47A
MYIDDVLVVEQAPFRNKIEDIGRIEYYANSSNTGTAYIDNFRLYQGIPYDRNDARLAGLVSSLGPLVKQGDGSYRLEVPYFMDKVELTATANSPEATSLTVNGESVVSGQPAEVSLAEGVNTIPVTVIAEDGMTTRTEQVIVIRTPAALDSTLKNLEVTGGNGEKLLLTPEFSYETDRYSISVPDSVYGLTVWPVAGAPRTEIQVNGSVVASGSASDKIELDRTVSEIAVTTASADGTDYRTYTINVQWEGSIPAPGEGEDTDSSVNPVSAVFDKNPANSKPVEVEVQLNGNRLEGIYNGEEQLAEPNYTVTDSVYRFSVPYLLR